MAQLTITDKSGANFVLYELSGAVNAYTLAELEQKLYDAIVRDNVVLDLSKVSDIDYSGMGTIMAAFNDGEANGHALYLLSPSAESREAVEATGFSQVLRIINSVTEVL